MMKTHYDNLQVARTASLEVIKGAYKHLTQKYHPDKNPENREESERILKIINRAYEVLSDPVLRKEHDDWISRQEKEQQGVEDTPRASNANGNHDFHENTPKATDKPDVSLWNPNASANWSLLFSPILGAFLHSRNWLALGDKSKANNSMNWVFAGIVIMIVALFIPENFARAVGIAYLLSWYFSSGRSQATYVKDKLKNKYIKKSWMKPLGLAALSLFTYIALAIFIFGAIDAADPEVQMDTAIGDINGAWKVTSSGALVTFQISKPEGEVAINESTFRIRPEKFDNVNKILTVHIDNDSNQTWAIRQIFDEKGYFTLQVTTESGEQFDMSFIRRL